MRQCGRPISGNPVLEVSDIHTYYGDSHVLHGISLSVRAGNCVAILGRNGAGKTTTLKCILGYVPARRGSIRFADADITREATWRIVRRGIGYVPEDRGIFPSLTVDEHLRIAFSRTGKGRPRRTPDDIYGLFPRLAERRQNYGNQLSGGEQQMLALGRALVPEPDLLILDEPSEGLAPTIVERMAETFRCLRETGKTMLLVEQNYRLATGLADRCYVLMQGAKVWEGTPDELEASPDVKNRHLGV